MLVEPRQKWSSIRAVVKRADGSVEDRGIISFTHRNPIINAVGGALARFNGWVGEKRYQLKRNMEI